MGNETDRSPTEHGLAFFKGMVDETGVGVAAYRSDGRYDYVNDAFAGILEKSKGAMIGEPIWTVNPRFDPERFETYWGSFDRGETKTAETVLERGSGGTVPVRTTTTQAVIDGTTYHFGTIQDISDRKRHEQRLRSLLATTREFMQAEDQAAVAKLAVETADEVLNQSITTVWLHDEQANRLVPVAATQSARELFETVPEFDAGEGIIWQCFERGQANVSDDVRSNPACYNPETPIRSEISLPLGREGIMIIGATTRGAFSELDVSLAKLLGVTLAGALERAEREATLREHRRELADQNEHLEQFAGVVSHDLRNPLNLARGKLRQAEETSDLEHLEAADEALGRMEGLIERTLSLARRGTMVGERERLSVDQVAKGCWDRLGLENGTLDVRDSIECSADAERLSQLLENLFMNARDHGSESVRVRIGTLDDGFFIEDDGPGIPVGERAAVFEAGYSSGEDGNGLGLSIVKLIADAHGWSVSITESEIGGARFEFRTE